MGSRDLLSTPDKGHFWLAVLLAWLPMLYFFSRLLPQIARQKTSRSLVFLSLSTLSLVVTFVTETTAIVLLLRATIAAPARWVVTTPSLFCALPSCTVE